MRKCRKRAPTRPKLIVSNTIKNVHRLIKSAKEAQPIEAAFLADLISCIEQESAEKRNIPTKTYKPSSMNCIRNMYFQVMGYQPEGSANYCLTGMGETGTARHEKIQYYLTVAPKYGIKIEYIDVEEYIKTQGLTHLKVIERDGYEVKLQNTVLNMRFLSDGVIKYQNRYFIFELKTESTYKEVPRKMVDPGHYVQGASYAANLDIGGIMFLYENRDNCHKKSFLFNVTDEMKYSLVLSRIEECDSYVKNMIIPPKPVTADFLGEFVSDHDKLKVQKKACEYCAYKMACRKAGK